MRSPIFTVPVQERGAAKRDGRPLRPRSEQHRHCPEQHVVSDDDVGREAPQNLQQTLVLSRNGVDEHSLQGDAQPVEPRGYAFQFGSHRVEIPQIEVRPLGRAWNFAPMASMRPRRTLPDRKAISWPSAIKMRAIASSGLRWPVAGVEAMRIFM